MKKTVFMLFAAITVSFYANAQTLTQEPGESGMEEISQAAMNEEIQEAEQSINELELVTDSPITSDSPEKATPKPQEKFNPDDYKLESLDEMDLGNWNASQYPEYIDIPNVDTILPSVNPADSYILKRAEKSTLDTTESKVKPSRTVHIGGSQYLDVFYPGKGWIYLGETANTTLLRYFGHSISTKDTMFTLRARGNGTAILHFYKIDPLDGTSIDDYLEVVISGTSDGTSHVTAPSYAETVPGKKYTPGQAESAQTTVETKTEIDLPNNADMDESIASASKTPAQGSETVAATSSAKTETVVETKTETKVETRESAVAETELEKSPAEKAVVKEEAPVEEAKSSATTSPAPSTSSTAKTGTTSSTSSSSTSTAPRTASTTSSSSAKTTTSSSSAPKTSTSTSSASSSRPSTTSSSATTSQPSSTASSSYSTADSTSQSQASSSASTGKSSASATDKRSSSSQAQSKSSGSSVIGSSADDELLDKAQKAYNSKKYGECLEYLTEFFNNAVTRLDEGLYLQGQALEAPSDYRNIKAALDTYETLVKQYPKSKKWKSANERVIYLKRFYFNIR